MQFFSLRLFWLLYTTSIARCQIANRDYLSRALPEPTYREGVQYTDFKLLTDKMKLLICKLTLACADEQSDIRPNTQSEEQETMSTMKLKHSNQGHKQSQWHNYPRQLDRLQSFNEESKNNNPVDSSRYEDKLSFYPFIDNTDHEQTARTRLQLLNTNSISDRLTQILPQANTLIRSFRLEDKRSVTKIPSSLEKEMNYLNNDLDDMAADTREMSPDEGSGLSFKLSNNNGVDAEPEIINQDDGDKKERVGLSDNEHMNVSKRVFSLWSRMQGMKPTVREIIHRKYFHSYSPPRVFRGDTLTAETRALVRPAGSPLRWG